MNRSPSVKVALIPRADGSMSPEYTKVPEEMPKGKKDDGLDMDEDMMMTGMSMFENEF